MFQWERLCAQNSAQVALVEGTLDADLVEGAWQSTLRDMGLGRVHLSEEGYSHEIWSGEPAAPLVTHFTNAGSIERFLEMELNRPFPATPAMPYRPFAMQHADGCYLGVVFQQWLADSVSIRLMMREWFVRIFAPQKARRKLIDLPRPRIARGPRLTFGPRDMFRTAREFWNWSHNVRRLARYPAGTDDNQMILRPITLPSVDVDRLLLVTRAEGCTVNDLLIALVATTLRGELTGEPTGGAKGGAEVSGNVAIATSIDLRPYLPGDLGETFGSLLAYAPVICPMPQENILNLAQEVARQTRRIKDPERIASKLVIPRMVAWWMAGKRPELLPDLYTRHIPVAAAVSNVNLNKAWPAVYSPSPIRRYLRVAAPGPAVPLSITATTLGETLDIMFSARRGVVSEAMADRIAGGFAQTLQALLQ